LLAKWFGACRATFNVCAAALNDGELLEGTMTDKQSQMRQLFLNKDSLAASRPWILEVPVDLREDAMRDTAKALAAYWAKKAENKKGFEFRFRSKRDEQNLVVRARH
jgi:CRISPR/Cas system-associated endonuclease Cas1